MRRLARRLFGALLALVWVGSASVALADEPVEPASPPKPESPVEADEASSFGLGAELSLRSRYVWRGLPFGDGPVLQPAAWASLWSCEAIGWANMPLPNAQQETDLDEVDLGAFCGVDVGVWSVSLGGWVYFFPGEDAPTTLEGEGVITAQFDWLNVFTGHAVDLRVTPGAYAGWVGVGGAWERGVWGVEGSLRTGWANAAFNEMNAGLAVGALDYVGAELAVPVALGVGLTLRTHAGAVVLLPDSLRDALDETVVLDFGATIGGEWAL
ncbi:hypothetical protein FIV42_24170 [Persicimonas caeni]|uniref:Uncharacterized protein n=1 Tax=Persicimonas caeni TaxID=2292766 RepID=A0A4Y6PZG8_PERCE|nr:hypothetical protein [Persicimonas caeni]QDG53726.1 hypothetical protein FIV42_24170 [Persicimonas caeni]QED34947.1 hypothetical protein FRD00_24165 [Persicimonas caeni]